MEPRRGKPRVGPLMTPIFPGFAVASVVSSLMVGGCVEMSAKLLAMGTPPAVTWMVVAAGISSLQPEAATRSQLWHTSAHTHTHTSSS